ncbi:MAG: hypothetical protein AAGG44_19720, partial [Planctomycetota bacterium]
VQGCLTVLIAIECALDDQPISSHAHAVFAALELFAFWRSFQRPHENNPPSESPRRELPSDEEWRPVDRHRDTPR